MESMCSLANCRPFSVFLKDNTLRMDQVVTQVLGSVKDSTNSVSGMSALTEELNATMEEMSGNANVIQESTQGVSEDVGDIARRADEMNDYSMEMKNHAIAMEQAARQSMNTIDQKVQDMLVVLRRVPLKKARAWHRSTILPVIFWRLPARPTFWR